MRNLLNCKAKNRSRRCVVDKLIFGFLICMNVISCQAEEAKLVDEYHSLGNGRYLTKIEFEGHSYVYLKNTWNAAGDSFLHDPGCKCIKQKGGEDVLQK